MKLSELQENWSTDSKLDETNLGREATSIPSLHAKYLNLLSSTKLQQRKAESDYFRLRRKKFRYYRGEMTQTELAEEEWVQWQGAKPLKNEMDEFLQCDDELIVVQDKVEYYRTMTFQLEQILRSINSRTWDIKNAIEWFKLSNGVM